MWGVLGGVCLLCVWCYVAVCMYLYAYMHMHVHVNVYAVYAYMHVVCMCVHMCVWWICMVHVTTHVHRQAEDKAEHVLFLDAPQYFTS